MTPVQVIKNLFAMLHNETSINPSAQLEQFVRLSIAAGALKGATPGAASDPALARLSRYELSREADKARAAGDPARIEAVNAEIARRS